MSERKNVELRIWKDNDYYHLVHYENGEQVGNPVRVGKDSNMDEEFFQSVEMLFNRFILEK